MITVPLLLILYSLGYASLGACSLTVEFIDCYLKTFFITELRYGSLNVQQTSSQ